MLCVALASAASGQQNASAADHAAAVAPFLSDDTFAVAMIDLAAIDPPALFAVLSPLMDLPERANNQAALATTAMNGVLVNLRTAGVRFIYVVGGIGDIQARGGPIAVVPLAEQSQAVVREQLQSLVAGLSAASGANGKPAVKFERHPSGALIVGSESAVDRYSLRLSTERPDLTGPLARMAADGATLAAVLAPGPDARRVIRELWPKLPPPVEGLTAPLLADRIKHVEFAAKLSTSPAAHIAFETTEPEATAALLQVIREIRQSTPQWPDREPAELFGNVLDALNARVDGLRVVGNLPTDQAQLSRLGAAVRQGLDAARADARRNHRMSNVRQLMLAMLNYESARRTLPPAAIRDAEGRPLLSWRVAILPNIGEKALYDQFRLNEPWDSPHNLPLVKRMPEMYRDPDPRIAALAGEGKTTFQVPVGPETLFYKNEGTVLREISDGIYRTVMLVEAVPERAVEWTKPADWEVDMQNPLDGVKRTDRDWITTGFGDGHVEAVRIPIDPAFWRALLTRAGKDSIN